MATTRSTALRTLIGAEHHENGAMFFRTLACIPALTGAWRDVGGGFSRSVGTWTERQIDSDALSRPDFMPTDGKGNPTPRTVNMSRLGEVLTDLTGSAHSPIHALIVWNCNPLVTVPNAELVRRGFERDDLFTIVHEQFMTDTARYADIVLPATTQIEADDIVFPWGHLWVSYNKAAIPPVGESCSNTELFRRLAAAMDLAEPSLFDDDETLMRQALPTIDIDELRREKWFALHTRRTDGRSVIPAVPHRSPRRRAKSSSHPMRSKISVSLVSPPSSRRRRASAATADSSNVFRSNCSRRSTTRVS